MASVKACKFARNWAVNQGCDSVRLLCISAGWRAGQRGMPCTLFDPPRLSKAQITHLDVLSPDDETEPLRDDAIRRSCKTYDVARSLSLQSCKTGWQPNGRPS
jgi:hypothetical protein